MEIINMKSIMQKRSKVKGLTIWTESHLLVIPLRRFSVWQSNSKPIHKPAFIMNIRSFFVGSTFLLLGALSSRAESTVLLTSGEFQSHLGSSYTETFDTIPGGSLGVQTMAFTDGGPGFSFTASVTTKSLGGMQGATESDHGWVGAGLRAREKYIPLTIDFDQPVTAVGGYFFGVLNGGVFSPGQPVNLEIEFETGSPQVESYSPSLHADSYRGFVATAENRITRLTITAPDSGPGFGDGHSSTSEITIGVIPEPSTLGLILSISSLGLVLARRRFHAVKG